MKVVLASSSETRKELLEMAGFDVQVRNPKVDETLISGRRLTPNEMARSLAAQKALDVWQSSGGEIILGADTIVGIDNEILGYPKDREDARRMLMRLSGRAHEVITGIYICGDYVETGFHCRTIVNMYELSDREIESYLDTGEYKRHAGAYDIDGRGGLFIERINGDMNNLRGMPVGLLIRQLRACGFRVLNT